MGYLSKLKRKPFHLKNTLNKKRWEKKLASLKKIQGTSFDFIVDNNLPYYHYHQSSYFFISVHPSLNQFLHLPKAESDSPDISAPSNAENPTSH